MKIATTIGEMYSFAASPVEAIKLYEGSGFRYLDCDLSIFESKHPFATENWKDLIFECKETAEKLGFSFVQAHARPTPIKGITLKRAYLV